MSMNFIRRLTAFPRNYRVRRIEVDVSRRTPRIDSARRAWKYGAY
jgi:hypothetical protein